MFTTYLGVYEPTVMFFGLTNSPAIFQVIMNNILREKKEEVREFVEEQLRKRYIQPLKSFQTLLVFFVEKKDRKKRMV